MRHDLSAGAALIVITAWFGFVAEAFAGADVFIEDFTASSANWANFNSSNILSHSAIGGPDGGGYAFGPRSFNNLFPGNATIFHRARHEDPFNSSNDAFKRDWIADGITAVNLYVRHNFTAAPLTYIMRVASEDNSMGHVYQTNGPQVAAGQWTPITFDVSRASAGLLTDEDNDYHDVFSHIGYVTIGVFVPGGLPTNPNGSNNDPTNYTFDLDKVSIATPEPAATTLVAIGLLGVCFKRGRRSHLRNRAGG
jgi:hypothetical protein